MERLGDLIRKTHPETFASVRRALLLAEVNRWIELTLPEVGHRAEAKALVGDTLVIRAEGGVVMSEVRLRFRELISHLSRRFPEAGVKRLKCLPLGSRLEPPML